MRGMVWGVLAMLAGSSALAQSGVIDEGPPASAEAQAVPGTGAGLVMQGVSAQVLKKIRSTPDRFAEQAAGLILGYGIDGPNGVRGIDAAGIARFVAVERAQARAKATLAVSVADLDGDGAVDRAEMQVMIDAAAVRSRGRMYMTLVAADTNGDGRVTDSETRDHARRRALDALPEAEAAELQAFLLFDLDGDGQVTIAEVTEAMAALRDPV